MMTEANTYGYVTITLAEYKKLIQKAYEYDNKYINLKNELKNSVNVDKESYENNLMLIIDEARRQIENCAIEQRMLNARFSAFEENNNKENNNKKKHWWQ